MEVRGGGGAPWLSRYSQRDCSPQRTPAEQRKRVRRKEQQRNHCVLTANPLISLVPLISPLKGLGMTSSNNKGRGGVWSETEPGKIGGKVFSPRVLVLGVVLF